MECVTIPSLAYIATQVCSLHYYPSFTLTRASFLKVRFALSSQAVFSRTDLVTDSEYFYNLIIDVLEDPEEHVEAAELLRWWNQYVVIPLPTPHPRPWIGY